jgi:hypothetical protein
MLLIIERQAESFVECVEGWHSQPEQDLALSKLDFEMLVKGSIFLQESIEFLHNQSMQGLPNLDLEQLVWNLYQTWLSQCESIERGLAAFEAQNLSIAGAADFRRRWKDTAAAMAQWARPMVAWTPLRSSEIRIPRPVVAQGSWEDKD